MKSPRAAIVLALSVASAAAALAVAPEARREGLNLNSFVQQGPVAAHVVLRSGPDPRLLVAFPAGNSGVGLWFDRVASGAEWSLAAAPRPIATRDDRGRPLHGVAFEALVRTPRLTVKRAVLSSVRVLRDYQGLGTVPDGVSVAPRAAGNMISWSRDRLDGAAGYRLSVTVIDGSLSGTTMAAGRDGAIRLAVTALTGETPLHPFAPGTLLTRTAVRDPAARDALQFLSTREKLLAGSWRFLTYFGRDTLMSVRLLMPVLTPEAVESGLRSVLVRLAPDGNVAHEEDIGEFAILDHRRADGTLSDAPTYNYAMIDSAWLLAPVAAAWLLDDSRGRARAAAFLAERRNGRTLGDALMANVRYLAAHAAPFAAEPRVANLVALRAGMDAGEWRDSNDGLGGGRYPYDVNAVLVPAALDAAAAMAGAGLLDRYAMPADRVMLARLSAMAATWRERAAPLFASTVPGPEARAAIGRYAAVAGTPAAPALAAVGGAVRFNAIALDAAGRPVPIQNSDDGFALLFAKPTADQLDVAAATLTAPFPAGLMTGAGMLVANPAFASTALQARFGPDAYHGTVIWSWQQALAAAGLARQIRRADLPAPVCARLRRAQDRLWQAIDASRSVGNSELWSWRYADGRYAIAPFGARSGDADESNAAQLWSTVYLAVQRPRAGEAGCGR